MIGRNLKALICGSAPLSEETQLYFMMLGIRENDEIVVRGPNIFGGYWNRPGQTEDALRGGWFHTGDQGEVNATGNWRIAGRIKNLIILGSGHKISPEPIETAIAKQLLEAQQVVIVGNGRGYLSAIVTGNVRDDQGFGCCKSRTAAL